MWVEYLLCAMAVGWVGTLSTLIVSAFVLGSYMPTAPEN